MLFRMTFNLRNGDRVRGFGSHRMLEHGPKFAISTKAPWLARICESILQDGTSLPNDRSVVAGIVHWAGCKDNYIYIYIVRTPNSIPRT